MSDFDVIVFGMLLAREGYRVLGIDRANATRLVSLASPQNLSDVAIPRTVLAEVLSVMAARCPDALLLLDEPTDAPSMATMLVPSAATMSPNVVVTGSLSKCHGVPGVRIGWVIIRNARPFLK